MEGASDLSAVGGTVPLLGDEAAAAIEQQALNLGITCHSCGAIMEGVGFEYVSLKAVSKDGRPTVLVRRAFICGEPDCAEAREEARKVSTAIRSAGGWSAFEGNAEQDDEQ
jgi:hypothetical protein